MAYSFLQIPQIKGLYSDEDEGLVDGVIALGNDPEEFMGDEGEVIDEEDRAPPAVAVDEVLGVERREEGRGLSLVTIEGPVVLLDSERKEFSSRRA